MEQDPGTAQEDETRVCASAELSEGQSLKFQLRGEKRDIPCFIIRHEGRLHAYVNECRHVAMTLDWKENEFFTEDGDHLFCPSHGACYLPQTGECIDGPPYGKKLYRVPLIERAGDVFAHSPQWTEES